MINDEVNIYRLIINKNIDELATFIKGYLYCGEKYNNLSEDEKLFQDNFHIWISNYYRRKDIEIEWNNLILFMNFNSTGQALDCFLELYETWYKEKFGEDAW